MSTTAFATKKVSANTGSCGKYRAQQSEIVSERVVLRLRSAPETPFRLYRQAPETQVLQSRPVKMVVKEFLKDQSRVADKRIFNLHGEIDQMLKRNADWNGYGSEPPNRFATELAKEIVLTSPQLGMMPSRVVMSAEGGVGVCFYGGARYADIESLNSGEVLAMKSDGVSHPEVWEVRPGEIKAALEEIREYLR